MVQGQTAGHHPLPSPEPVPAPGCYSQSQGQTKGSVRGFPEKNTPQHRAAGASEAMQPIVLLRAAFGMHDQALESRVMAVLREHIETKPKSLNISFSEDNGCPMPTGVRLDLKIYPRNSTVHVDRRHWWSKKWSWGLCWQLGHGSPMSLQLILGHANFPCTSQANFVRCACLPGRGIQGRDCVSSMQPP